MADRTRLCTSPFTTRNQEIKTLDQAIKQALRDGSSDQATISRAVGRCSRVGRLSVEEFVAIKRALCARAKFEATPPKRLNHAHKIAPFANEVHC